MAQGRGYPKLPAPTNIFRPFLENLDDVSSWRSNWSYLAPGVGNLFVRGAENRSTNIILTIVILEVKRKSLFGFLLVSTLEYSRPYTVLNIDWFSVRRIRVLNATLLYGE